MFYEELRTIFTRIADDRGLLDEAIMIESSVLTPDEAIGTPDRTDFPLQKGKDVLMEANFMGAKSQAYTDSPSHFRGSLQEIVALELADPAQKTLFIAALNAVARHAHPDLKTLHCRNEGPERCAGKIAAHVGGLGPRFLGMVGLQPAILEALAAAMGKDRVRCIDRDKENLGRVKDSVSIEWGDDRGLKQLFEGSDLVLATGSSAANGSLPFILSLSGNTETPVYFYGTTIAGTARLLGLNHLCYESRQGRPPPSCTHGYYRKPFTPYCF